MTTLPTASVVSLYATTRAKLVELDMLEDPAGVTALILAQQIDRRNDSGASLAALARQHATCLADVLRRATIVDDPLDELARRRDEKRAAAK